MERTVPGEVFIKFLLQIRKKNRKIKYFTEKNHALLISPYSFSKLYHKLNINYVKILMKVRVSSYKVCSQMLLINNYIRNRRLIWNR